MGSNDRKEFDAGLPPAPDEPVTGLLDTRADRRRLAQHPTGGRRLTIGGLTFDARLPYDLAVELEPAAVVFDRYGIDEARAAMLLEHPLFVRALATAKAELKESGLTFRMKARVMAEELLDEAYVLATDAESPANVRADLIKWAAKMGDLEPAPKDKAGVGGFGAGGFQLNITLQGEGAAAGRVLEVTGEADTTPGADARFVVPRVVPAEPGKGA